MKNTKFLAFGIAAMTIAFSAHADNGQNIYGEMNDTGHTQKMETPAFLKDAGSFFSKVGGGIKSGVQTATMATGKAMQKTGKGIQNLADDFSGENREKKEIVSMFEADAPQPKQKLSSAPNKDKSLSNIKKVREANTDKKNDKITNTMF